MWKCCQRGNVANVKMLPVSNVNAANSSAGIGNLKLGLATLAILATFLSAHAENAATPNSSTFQPFNLSTHSYTNHAGNVVSGWPVKLTAKQVVLCEGNVNDNQQSTDDKQLTTHNSQLPNSSTFQPFNISTTNTYPLSIFPESEQRRIAADFGQPRVPVAVKRAITGADKAMARSRKRAEKGLCTKEESDDFCMKSAAALKSYLDKRVEEGVITPAERKALGR